MKFYDRSILFCAAIVAGWFWSSSASAVNLIYEPFDYTSGVDLLGQRNTSTGTTAGTAVQADTTVGNLWRQAANTTTSVVANSIDIASGSLNAPAEASTLKSAIGNSLTILDGTNNGAADRLAFRADATSASNITSGTIFYSFLLNVGSLTGANNTTGDYFISLNNTANANTTANPTVVPGQMRIRIDPTDGSKYDLGMFTQRSPTAADTGWSNNTTAGTPISLTTGQTYFVVGAFDNIGSTTTNRTRLWINPDQTFFGGATAAAITAQDNTAGSNATTIGSLLLHQRNLNPELGIDELRVGTTWAEVTPLGTPTLYWDINGSLAGAGGAGSPAGTWDGANTNWNNVSDGTGNALQWSAGGVAVFSAGSDANSPYTVTVSGTQSVAGLTFKDTAATATLTGGTVSLSGLHTITTNSGVTANIDSAIGGTVGFVKDGSGTLVLTGNQSYSGDTSVNGGTLQIGNGGTTGTLPTGSAITDNGRLTINRSNAVVQGTDFSGAPITGSGGLTQAGSDTLTLNAANTFSGTTRASAGTLLLTNSLALQNSILDLDAVDTGTVVVDSSLSSATVGALAGSRNLALLNGASSALALTVGNATGTYSGALSDSGSLTKAGAGAQTLTGTNTYTGGTTINGGTLQFGQTVSMPASGAVAVNNGGTFGINAGGAGEWTDSAVSTDPASIASIIAGTGGQGTANQVTWNSGSTLAIDTTNASGGMTYTGVIGSFRTTGGGTTNAVGFTKRGANTLTLTANNTFSGPLSIAANSGTLMLTGTNANAGTTMTIPTVGIGAGSILEIGASDALPSGSLITTQGGAAQMFLDATFTQTIRSLSGNNGVVTVQAGAVLTIADQAGDDYVFGNGASTANLRSVDTAKIYKTGAGTLTLFGDAGNNFNGEFIMQNGTLKLSRNQALGNTGGTGKLTVVGGQLARSNTPTSNFTYSLSNLDLHVFRFDLSDAPLQASQFTAATITTLKQNDVEMNITTSGAVSATAGRFNFLGDIRNHDPSPTGGDDPNAIRGITKTGNGILTFANATSYRGSTTVMDGALLVTSTGATMATLGDYTQPTIGTLYLKGGILATNATRTSPIKNPIVVDGNSGIGHISTTINLASVVMEFDTDSVVGTSGSLTISNLNSGTGNTVFKPLFTGKNFNFGLPITISSATGSGSNIKSNELQGGNFTDTQTFSGVISGGGSLRRVNAGGTTVLSGNNTYSGGTFVDAGTLEASGSSATFGSGNVTVTGGVLSIASAVANAIANTATLSIASPGMVSLGTGINEFLAGLILDNTPQANGTYGSTASAATFTNDTYFSGAGILTIGPAGLPGDFNSDGKVDAGDYVTWRKNQNTNNALANDNGLGTPVGTAHYDLWRANFGNPPGAGAGGGLDGAGAVPEPGSLSLVIFAIGSALITCSSKFRRRRS